MLDFVHQQRQEVSKMQSLLLKTRQEHVGVPDDIKKGTPSSQGYRLRCDSKQLWVSHSRTTVSLSLSILKRWLKDCLENVNG